MQYRLKYRYQPQVYNQNPCLHQLPAVNCARWEQARIHQLSKFKEIVLGCTHYELAYDAFSKYCLNTKFLNNSEFLLNDLNFTFESDEVNVVIKMSKQNQSLENKILRLLKEN